MYGFLCVFLLFVSVLWGKLATKFMFCYLSVMYAMFLLQKLVLITTCLSIALY